MPEIALKIVVLGDEEVGKTSIILKYTKNRFTEDYKPTLGADFAIRELKYNEFDVKLYIWDIGGVDKHKDLHKFYFEGADTFLLVYDITRYNTFENAINLWIPDIELNLKSASIILVGNKNDLETRRQISRVQINGINSNNLVSSIETSAKTGNNIEKVFLNILKEKL